MQFCGKTIPGSLFKLARDLLLAGAPVTAAQVRSHLLEHGGDALMATNALTANHPIIANRVFNAARDELRGAGQITSVKRGVWVRVPA